MDFKSTHIYRLGKIYKELGETLMNPKTDIRDLVELGQKYGFQVKMEILPNNNSPLNGED